MELLRANCDRLTAAITPILYTITNALYAKGLIPQATLQQVLVMGVVPDNIKAMQLMLVVEQQLESSLDQDQYMVDTCHVLLSQQVTDIATFLLHQLGELMHH